MINIKQKNNIGPALRNSKEPALSLSKGFTLVETMVAVFILAFIVSVLLGLIAQSLYNFKYNQNEMTANYLIQEATDYIRNDRDSLMLGASSQDAWNIFKSHYTSCQTTNGCSIDKVTVDPSSTNIHSCKSSGCPFIKYDSASSDIYYSETGNNGVITTFRRKIEYKESELSGVSGDLVSFRITVYWKNGNIDKSKTLTISLTRWLS